MKKKLKNILREGEPDLMPPGEDVTVPEKPGMQTPDFFPQNLQTYALSSYCLLP